METLAAVLMVIVAFVLVAVVLGIVLRPRNMMR